MPEPDRTHTQPAVFNMALAQLQLINGILRNITNLGALYSEDKSDESLSPGQAQHLKSRWVKQLFIQSTPLLDPKTDSEWREETWRKMKGIQLKYGRRINTDQQNVGRFEGFDAEVENQLDYIVIQIVLRLQKHNYFMPPKDDPRFGWSPDR